MILFSFLHFRPDYDFHGSLVILCFYFLLLFSFDKCSLDTIPLFCTPSMSVMIAFWLFAVILLLAWILRRVCRSLLI